MIKLDIHAEESFARIHEMLRDFPGGVEKATRGVISRATTTARATTLKGITSVYDIQAKDVRDRERTTINMRTQTVDGGIVGVITFSGNKIPLYRFGVSHKTPKSQGHKVPVKIGERWVMASPGIPVKAREKKASPMKQSRTAFIATMSNGHTGIFDRKNKGSSKITERMGASTAEMAQNANVLNEVETATMETIVKRTEREITRIINGYGGR